MVRKVLFLCQFFYPEPSSSARLPFDTARVLARQGYQVDALCGMPNRKDVPAGETVDGVRITRLNYAKGSKRSRLGRISVYFSFMAGVLLRLGRMKGYDAIFVYSNPPVLPLAALLARKLWGTRLIFVSYDVYPEIAVQMASIPSGGLVDRLMSSLNRRLARGASAVVAISDDMRQFLLTHRPGLSEDRVFAVYPWAHEENLPPKGSANSLREKYGIPPGAFVVSYIGNFGICQDMHTILAAARRLKNAEDILFLLAGDGVKREEIWRTVQREKLTNVKILGAMPPEDCALLQQGSDCCIVSLEPNLTGLCAPSKYQSCLYAGKPMLMIADRDFCFCAEIEAEQTGFAIPPGDDAFLTQKIEVLAADRALCCQCGRRARVLYERKYSCSIAMGQYAQILNMMDKEAVRCGS